MAIKVSVAPKGMGLNDFVAMQEGFFRDEGLDVEFDMKTFRGTQSSWKDLQYFDRPQDRPFRKAARLFKALAPGAASAMPVPEWGNSCPTATASHRGAFSCGRTRGSNGPKTSRMCRSRSACAQGATSTSLIGWKNICRWRTSRPSTLVGLARGSPRCSTARWKPQACCRRKSTWPSNSACAPLSRIRSTRSGGCRTICRPMSLAKYLRALDRAEKALEANLRQVSSALEILDTGRVPGSALGFRQVQPRRAVCLRAGAQSGVRRGHAAGRSAGGSISISRSGNSRSSFRRPLDPQSVKI